MPLKRKHTTAPATPTQAPTAPISAPSTKQRFDLAKLPSYKTPWGQQANTWRYSEDCGATDPTDTGSSSLEGKPLGLYLEISPARKWAGTDYRLRLPMITDQGPAELNLNAVNVNQKTELEYVTSPVKSLLAGLESISESEEDMAAFMAGARFDLVRGTKSIFIELSAWLDDHWSQSFTDARTTNLYGPKTPQDLVAKLALIHRRFTGAGFFETTPKACFCAQELMNQIMGGSTAALSAAED